jgi:hypothetical protein
VHLTYIICAAQASPACASAGCPSGCGAGLTSNSSRRPVHGKSSPASLTCSRHDTHAAK